jgi:hypothetical protein
MAFESPRIRSLLRQADSVAESGKRAAAAQLYRQIIEEAPKTAQAWHGLAQVAGDPGEKEAAMRQAVSLNPEYGLTAEVPDETQEAPADPIGSEPVEGGNNVQAVPFSEDGHPAHSAHGDPSAEHNHSEDIRNAQPANPVNVADQAIVNQAQALFCANHPSRNTHLRCNRCGKLICSSCANATPVGYRCPECIREQEDVYFTATPVNYLLAVLVALPLSLVAGWLATLLGFWSIFLAAFAGTLIGRVAFKAAGRRRGRWLPHLVTACVITGAVLPILLSFFRYGGLDILRILFTGIYIVMATGATYYQMR